MKRLILLVTTLLLCTNCTAMDSSADSGQPLRGSSRTPFPPVSDLNPVAEEISLRDIREIDDVFASQSDSTESPKSDRLLELSIQLQKIKKESRRQNWCARIVVAIGACFFGLGQFQTWRLNRQIADLPEEFATNLQELKELTKDTNRITASLYLLGKNSVNNTEALACLSSALSASQCAPETGGLLEEFGTLLGGP